MDKIKTYFRLLIFYGKLDFSLATREFKLVVLQFGANISTSIASTIGILIIYINLNINTEEPIILLFIAYPILLNGLYSLFFSSGNWGRISRVISRGQLDSSLTQPLSLPMQFFTQGFAPFTAGIDFLFSSILFIIACIYNNLFSSFLSIIIIVICIISSFIILVSSIFLCSTLTFFAPIATEEISDTVYELITNTKAYQLDRTPYIFRIFFSSIIPIGLLAWLPEKILSSNTISIEIIYLIFFAIFYALAVSIIFKKGLYHYEKTGSARSSNFGYK